MARAHRVHMKKPTGTTTGTQSDVVSAHHIRQEFAAKLYNLMLEKRWTQSDLMRASGLTSRDSISTYVGGRSLPSPLNLEKIAQALGVTPEFLLPHRPEGAIQAEYPTMRVTTSSADPSQSFLQINRIVPARLANEIERMIIDADEEARTERKAKNNEISK